MARRARNDFPGSWHHVVNRGIARRPLFEDREDIRYFLSRLAREVRRGRLEVHAWCVLTTHFHLLVRSPQGELSEAMRRAQNEYSRFFNRRHRRDGTLIRGRFLSKPVDTLAYRRVLLRYIDANPVVAGLVEYAWLYPWGSAASYARGAGPPWLEREWVEGEVALLAGRLDYRREDYARVFVRHPSPGAMRLVELRLERAAGVDALDDLIGAAPDHVRKWMERKARLADRAPIGVPVCDARSIADAAQRRRNEEGDWIVSPNERRRDGWELARIGLTRSLAGLTWDEIGQATGSTRSTCHASFALHRRLLREDPDYLERVARLAGLALHLCHMPAGSGESG